MERDKQWMNWLSSSSNMKKFSPTPMGPCLSCGESVPRVPAIQTGYILVHTCMDQYLSYQELELLCSREDIVITDHPVPEWPQKRHEKLGWKIYLNTLTGVWFAGKTTTKWGSSGKLLFPFQAGSFPNRGEELVLLLILIKRILFCIHKKWVTNMMIRTRRALPPVRWKKGTTGFTGLCDFNGQWEYKALVDSGAQGILIPPSYREAEPISISWMTRVSQHLIVLEAKVTLSGNEWQKPLIVTGLETPCILGRDSEEVFQGPKG